MRTRIKTGALAGALAALMGLFALCGAAQAEDAVKVVPTVSARETYDSNINFMGKGDFEHSVTPGVQLTTDRERFRGSLSAKAPIYKYSERSEFDRVDQNYEGGLEYNATERVTMNLRGALNLDHAFSSALADTGERATSTSRRNLSAQPSVTFSLDEVNSLTLFSGFTQTDYDSKRYSDSQDYQLGGRWGYRYDPRTLILLQVTGDDVEARTGTQHVLSAMAGFEYSLIETLKARVLAGASQVEARIKGVAPHNSITYATDSSLEWRRENMLATLSFSRDTTMGINGESLVRDRFNAYVNFDWTERLSFTLGGSLTSSENTDSTAQGKTTNVWTEIQPALRYRLGEQSNLMLGYAYGTSKSSDNEIKKRSRAFCDFNMTFQ